MVSVLSIPTAVVGTGGTSETVPVLVLAAVLAGAFVWLRPRAARLADRIVFGGRATPYEVLSEFSDRVGETYAADDVLPRMAAVFAAKGVEMRCDPQALAIVQAAGVVQLQAVPASETDWDEEYLAPIIAVKVVAGLDEAITHINRHGSHHTDAILTNDHRHAQRFLREVDSASVMVNTSTRFADGFEFGLGAEIGISTDKFHARGPVGIEGLTSLKYVVLGDGEVRQ